MRRRRPLTIILLGLVLAACHETENNWSLTGIEASGSPVIAAAGGTVEAPATGGISGAKIVIPPGSLSKDTTISIRPSANNRVNLAAGPVIDFGPDGTRFNPPARITLPYEPALLPAGFDPTRLILGELLANGAVVALNNISVDAAAGLISADVGGFSDFVSLQPGSINLPQPPNADAGSDQTSVVGNQVTLDGRASNDVNGDALTFQWSLRDRPAGSSAELSDSTATMPLLPIDLPGIYRIELTVNDGSATSDPDEVIVSTLNSAPLANAGADQSAPVGQVVMLSADGSSDVDGDPLTYIWSIANQPQGSLSTLSDPTSLMPELQLDVSGEYSVQLIVNDGEVDSAPDTVRLVTSNSAPVANAGSLIGTSVLETVSLNGSASSDIDGDPLSFSWSLITVPTGSVASLDDATSIMPSLIIDQPGQYVAQLIVSDGELNSAPATVIVSTVNSAPRAVAGNDQVVDLGATVNLNGLQSTDVDGDELSFLWSLISAPLGSEALLSDVSSAAPSFTADVGGEYVAQLIVNDGELDSQPDTVLISTRNAIPVARAGDDQTVVHGQAVSLDGGDSSDADGDPLVFPLVFRWSITSAPEGSAAQLTSADTATTGFTPVIPGTYLVQLIVNDGRTDSAPDTLLVTVTNTAPIAEAGANRWVEIGNPVELSGSESSDADGDALSYRWRLVTSPPGSIVDVSNENELSTSLNPDVAGDYVVELEVSDGFATSTDVVTVTGVEVNQAPIANAGADKIGYISRAFELDGAASSDPNSDPLTFQWVLSTKPDGSASTLDNTSAITPSFTPDVAGEYRASLIVSDGVLDSFADEVRIAAVEFVDIDEDSFGDAVDCNDFNAEINPGALEICGDGIDNNCDGAIDNVDADGDGFRSLACNGTDVDDLNAAINRNGVEICADGVDNDSNGLTDGLDPACAAGCDRDGDRDPGAQCAGLDSDDTDATVNRNANEICDDFVDNDQDGEVDEGCPGGLRLGRAGLQLLSGDSEVLRTIDPEASGQYRYEVNGIVGGNSGVGTVIADAIDPTRAVYQAPQTDTRRSFTVTVRDTNTLIRSADVVVTVLPVIGGVASIVPANAEVGLNATSRFSAIYTLPGGIQIPIRNARWSINGTAFGSDETGKIDSSGLYRGPRSMPTPMPFSLTVSFQLSDGGPVIASAPFRLARMALTPHPLTVYDEGDQGAPAAQLFFSDGTTRAVGTTQLNLFSNSPEVAKITPAGTIDVQDVIGRSVITGQHSGSGATASLLVDSRRRDLELHNAYIPLLGSKGRRVTSGFGGVSELEFTTPGTSFQIVPTVRLASGFDQDASVISGDAGLISLSIEGDFVATYEDPADEPDAENVSVTLQPSTGLVTIGAIPETATLRAVYEDGPVRIERTTLVRYVRPELEVSVTDLSDDPYVTGAQSDFVKIRVRLVNPEPDSTYVEEARVRVTRADGGLITALVAVDPASGRNRTVSSNTAERFFDQAIEGREIELRLPAGSDFTKPYSQFGRVNNAESFLLALAHDDGDVVYQFERLDDPLSRAVETTINTTRTRLGYLHCTPQRSTFQSSPPLLTRPVMQNTAATFFAGPDADDIRFAPKALPGLSIRHAVFANDFPQWFVTQPDGNELSLLDDNPANSLSSVPIIPTQLGEHSVRQRFNGRPGIGSVDTVFEVVDGSAVADFPVVAQRNETLEFDIPRNMQLGALEVVSPPPNWLPGEPFEVILQSVDADGVRRALGYTDVNTTILGDGSTRVERRHISIRVRLSARRNFASAAEITGTGRPDPQGRYVFTVVPFESLEPGGNIFVELRQNFDTIPQQIPDAESAGFDGLFPERRTTYDTRDRTTVVSSKADVVVAQFEGFDQKNLFLRPCIVSLGSGVVPRPRVLPLPTQRLRDMAANPDIESVPEDAVIARTLLLGSEDFLQAIGGASVDFARTNASLQEVFPGAEVVASETTGEGLIIDVTTDPQASYPEFNGTYTLFLTDGSGWPTFLRFVAAELRVAAGRTTTALLLNGKHEGNNPRASQTFNLGLIRESTFQPFGPISFDLELISSIKPGDVVRGLEARRPLVMFDAERQGETSRKFMPNLDTTPIIVYGNTRDTHNEDPELNRLVEGADNIPDFHSETLDAEQLVVKVGENWLDAQPFTAFKVVARADTEATPLNLPDLSYQPGAREAIEEYRLASLPIGDGLSPQTGLRDRVRVHVDHEAGSRDTDQARNRDGNNSNDRVGRLPLPLDFRAGMLDQAFGAKIVRPLPVPIELLGRDGRVGAYDGEGATPREFSITGVDRRSFGLELDGALYDTTLAGIDELPNSEEFTNLAVVNAQVPNLPDEQPGLLTNQLLLRDIGGSSGGYFDVDADRGGAHFITAKLPGAELPGLHGTYLVDGAPADQLERIGITEDDLEDLRLTRRGPSQFGIQTPLVEDGLTKRALIFGNSADKKAPVKTALSITTPYRIETLPAGVDIPAGPAGILIKERDVPNQAAMALLVASQSNGDEETTKLLADTTSDLLIDIAATALITTMTAGTYAEFCGADIAGNIAGSLSANLINLGTGYYSAGVDSQTASRAAFANGVLSDGQDFTPLPGYRPTVGGIVSDVLVDEFYTETGNPPMRVRRPGPFNRTNSVHRAAAGLGRQSVCAFFGAPVNLIKDAVKASYTVDSLGGNGNASAVASRSITIAIPPSAIPGLEDGSGATGTPVVQFGLTRKIDIIPDEPSPTDLSQRPNLSRYDLDAGLISDNELLSMVLNDLDDPDHSDAAGAFLRRLAVNSVIRKPRSDAANEVMSEYRLRAIRMPSISAVLAPGAFIGGDRVVDFEVKPGETVIPVTYSSMGLVSRSNENATARVNLTSPGLDVVVIGYEIPQSDD